MPVDLRTGSRETYYPEIMQSTIEQERRQQQELMSMLGNLAQGYQNFQTRKADRSMFNEMMGGGSTIDRMRGGGMPMGAAINDPNSPLTSPPGARFNVQTGQPIRQGQMMPQQQRPGFMSRMMQGARSAYDSQRPLNTLETAMAEARLKQMFPDPQTEMMMQYIQAIMPKKGGSGSATGGNLQDQLAQAEAMGAVGYDPDLGVWVDENGDPVF